MRDFITFDTAPVDENSIQVNPKTNYLPEMRIEARKYAEFLQKRFPEYMEYDCNFSIKSQQHDFGTYYETVIYFNDKNEKSISFAFFVERNLPKKWADIEVLKYEKNC